MELDELVRLLRGELRIIGGLRAVETSIGGLPAAVILRENRLELAVASTSARELDVLHPHEDEWHAKGHQIPSLSHGYIFAGCRGGILIARPIDPPSTENIVSTLWELAAWARLPWQHTRHRVATRRELSARMHELIERLEVAATVAAIAAIARRARWPG